MEYASYVKKAYGPSQDGPYNSFADWIDCLVYETALVVYGQQKLQL